MTRRNLMITLLGTLLGLIAPMTLQAADPKDPADPKIFAVPRHGGLALMIPKGWKDTVKPVPQPDFPPTIELTTDGKKFLVLITALPSRGGEPDFNSPAKLKTIAEGQGRQMLATAKEQTISVEELKGDKAVGYFWTLTDKAPDPGSFECVTTAFVGVGDLILSVTILHHEKDAPERQAALDMLKAASQKAAVALTELRVAAPGAGWELVMPIKGLTIVEEKENPARKMKQVTAEDAKSGLVVSIFMEPSRKEGDSSTVRDVYWGRAKDSPMRKENIKLDKVGDYATVDYLVPDIGGQAIQQKNVNAYVVHEGVWIDVHLSKVQFSDKDQPLFDEAVKGMRFAKPAALNPKAEERR